MQKSPAGDLYAPAVVTGGFIHLSGVSAAERAGDVEGQTRDVIRQLGDALAQAGASLDRVVAVMVYLKSAADFPAMNAAYAGFWTADPPTRTTVIAGLLRPGALVEISAIAVASERTIVRPKDWIASPSPYSYAIRSGDLLFLAGLVSRNGRDNGVVAGDITTQTRVVLDNAGELLRADGLDFEHVVSARVFLPDSSSFEAMNAAYRTYFPSIPPARATVAAGLAGSQYLVEMTLTASAAPRMRVEPAQASRPQLPLSSAVRAGTRLFLSGVLGKGSDAGSQASDALRRIRETLRAAAFTPEQVVEATVFVTDPAHAAAVERPLREFLPRRAAGTTVVTPLVARDALVEIMLTAARQ